MTKGDPGRGKRGGCSALVLVWTKFVVTQGFPEYTRHMDPF